MLSLMAEFGCRGILLSNSVARNLQYQNLIQQCEKVINDIQADFQKE